jgi:hypothetical protein
MKICSNRIYLHVRMNYALLCVWVEVWCLKVFTIFWDPMSKFSDLILLKIN